MNSPLTFLTLLATIATASAGEVFRFDAEIGPDRRAATLHGFAFRERQETLRVVDLAATPAGRIGDAFVKVSALAGCNGGSIRTDGQPLGLVIADSIKTSPLVTGEPGSEGVLSIQNGGISLMRSDTAASHLEKASQALQGGPFLVENGTSVAGLDAEHFARRTVIVTSGTGDWAIVYSPSTTLDRLAHVLADGKSFSRFKIATALNLAGGAASGIWFQRSEGAPALYLREVSAGPNALAIMPK